MYWTWRMKEAVRNWDRLGLSEVDGLIRQLAGRCRSIPGMRSEVALIARRERRFGGAGDEAARR